MSQQQWTEVDNYINDLFVRHDSTLEETLKSSHEAGLPAISVSPAQGKLLNLLAKLHDAQNILEIGTLGGYSTIWLARALPRNGRMVTLEAEPKHAEVAAANIDRAGFKDQVEVRLGKAVDIMSAFVTENRKFDMIFIDADKESYPQYLELSLKLSHVSTVIVADNVVRKGEVANAESTDACVLGVRRFNDLLANEKRVSATVIQTVGGKGYDGFAIAMVIGEG